MIFSSIIQRMILRIIPARKYKVDNRIFKVKEQ